MSTAATYSLLPLLYRPEEYATKLLLLALHVSCVWLILGDSFQDPATKVDSGDGGTESLPESLKRFSCVAWKHIPQLFTAGLVLLEAYCSGIHGWLFGESLSFLPLMLTSVYCSIGMSVVWAGMAAEYILGQ